jgi:hypothetical protein
MAPHKRCAFKAPYCSALPPLHIHQRPPAATGTSARLTSLSKALLFNATDTAPQSQNSGLSAEAAPGQLPGACAVSPRCGSLFISRQLEQASVDSTRIRNLHCHLHECALFRRLSHPNIAPVAASASSATSAPSSALTIEPSPLLLRVALHTLTQPALRATAATDAAGNEPVHNTVHEAVYKLAASLQADAEALAERVRAAGVNAGAAWVQQFAPVAAAEVCWNGASAADLVAWMRSFNGVAERKGAEESERRCSRCGALGVAVRTR